MASSSVSAHSAQPSQSILIIGSFGMIRTFRVRVSTHSITTIRSPIMNQCIACHPPKKYERLLAISEERLIFPMIIM